MTRYFYFRTKKKATSRAVPKTNRPSVSWLRRKIFDFSETRISNRMTAYATKRRKLDRGCWMAETKVNRRAIYTTYPRNCVLQIWTQKKAVTSQWRIFWSLTGKPKGPGKLNELNSKYYVEYFLLTFLLYYVFNLKLITHWLDEIKN